MDKLAVILLLLAGAVHAEQVSLRQPYVEGTVVLRFDTKEVDGAAVQRYMVIHPTAYDAHYHISPGIRLCIAGESGYLACGSRDLHARYFFENARYNLGLARKHLAYLDSLREFPELRPLVEHFAASLRFSIWIDERTLAYLQSWDTAELEQNYSGLQVVDATREIIAALGNSHDSDERWKLVTYKWHNAVNRLYREQEGPVPVAVWQRFLRERRIVETIESDDVDLD